MEENKNSQVRMEPVLRRSRRCEKIIFFDAKPYDQEFFDAVNGRRGDEINFPEAKQDVFLR